MRSGDHESSPYDDFMSALFVPRVHPAYPRRQRADKRCEHVQNKFFSIQDHRRVLSEQKFNDQVEKMNRTLTERLNK